MTRFAWRQALVLTATASLAQTASPPAMPPGLIGEPSGTGPYPAVAEVPATLADHTIYRPVKAPPEKMPILLWGNGACRDNGLAYARFLREIASHGYLVVAAGHARREEPMRPAQPFSTAPAPPAGASGVPPPRKEPDETQASQLIAGLDWAIAENGRKGGPFFRRLDTRAVAVAGHSCGGLQAIVAAADPRVRTMLVMNSGVYNRGADAGRSQVAVDKDQLRAIHGPVAYINGGPSDIAYENARDDFRRIDHVPALFAWLPVGHGGTYFTQANGGEYALVTIAWLDWRLKGSRSAAAMFTGPNCGLCRRNGWTMERKNFPAEPTH